jgi:hypothetical protein
MGKYKILAWSASKTKNDYNASPIIYFKPDNNFKKYAYNNNDIIYIKVYGTNSLYDNRKYKAIVSTSEDVPCFRPNFYNLTGQFILTLDSNWMGFPGKMGWIEIDNIMQFTEKDDIRSLLDKEYTEKNIVFRDDNTNNNTQINKKWYNDYFYIMIIVLSVCIGLPLIILIIFVLFSLKKKSLIIKS